MTYSIIQKSQLEGAQRLDAEYFQPVYLEIEKKLNSIPTETIAEISSSVVNFGAYSLCNFIVWQESGVPYINVGDVKDGHIDYSNIKYIDEKVNEILKKSQVEEGQIILTMAGSIGNVAVAHNVPDRINSNQATAKITLKEGYSAYYIAAFLLSQYGQNQIKREIVSSVQPNIFLFQIKDFKVPIASEKQQLEIEKLYKESLKELDNSKLFNKQAEDLLLEELGLKDFKPEENIFSIVNLSDIQAANRIDAEFFQIKFQKLLEKMKSNNPKKLGDLVSIKKGFEPGSEAYQEEGKSFIRVSNLSKDGLVDGDQKYLTEELYKKLKQSFQPKVGETLLTKDATPGIAYVLKEPIEGIVSGGILRLKTKDGIDNEYLSLVINSIIGQYQAERDAGGSIIAHWKPEQIKNILIPILPQPTQQKIAELIRKSHLARQKSKELLDEAKRKVETSIGNSCLKSH